MRIIKIVKLTFICFLVFNNALAKFEPTVIFKYSDENRQDKFLNKHLKQNSQGPGEINGQLFYRESGNLLEEDIKTYAVLYKLDSRFGSWDAVASVDTEVGHHYEFNGLELGEYAVIINWRHQDIDDPGYETAFLSSIWSPAGGESCHACEPNINSAISLTSESPVVDADFLLDKAAVLELSLITPYAEEISSYPLIYSFDSFEVKRMPRYTITRVNFDPFGSTTYDTKAVFVLPEGSYRLFAEPAKYQGFIYGESESCRHCEFKVKAGSGQSIGLTKNQPQVAEINLKYINGGFKGLIKETNELSLQIIDFNHDTNYYDFYTQNNENTNSEYPLELHVTNLASGYYMMSTINHANPFSDPATNPNYYAYPNVYGGDYCDRPHCDFDNVTPILIHEFQTTQLRPQNTTPTGGMIIGRTFDPLTSDGQPIKDAPTDAPYASFYRANWLSIYNVNKELITTNYASGPFQINLPAGHYYVKTGHGNFGFTNRYYASTLYPNVDCAGRYCDFSQGTLVEVKDGENTIINDIALKRGQGIKGQVTNKQTGQGLNGIRVEVFDSEQHLVSSALTSVDGYYSHWGLLPGDYYLRTNNGSKSLNERYNINKAYTGGYINQLYPNTTCPNNQCDFSQVTPVTITNEDINNVDFSLNTGDAFSGVVTDIISGAPLYKKRIKIYQLDGTLVGNHLTDQFGSFTTSALLPADYKILVEGGYLYFDKAVGNDEKNCLFEACEWNDAQNMALSSEPLNIKLTHKKDVLPNYTGMWFNPEESGHGLQFEVLDQDDAAILYVTWFAHVDGEPMWLTGSGPLLGDRAFVDLIITNGQDFPDSMNAAMWGELRVKFDNLNRATLSWTPLLESFEAGELTVERLTIPAIPETDAYVNADLDIDACITGSYYDPERSGEGIQITAMGDPVNYLSFNWYTYRDDQQFWFTGQGDVNQDQTTSLAYYTHGTNFTPDFNANDIETTAWGEVRIQKIPDDKLEIQFNPNTDHSDFEAKTTELIRNSSPFAMDCGLQ